MPIICGTDLSAASSGALEVARALAAQRGDEVILVHIGEESAQESLETQAGGARTALIVGTPDEALVNFAETEGSDLIVIAARSYGTDKTELGSTAAQVIARTTVPVIVVRDPAPWLGFANNLRPLRVLLGIDDSVTCDLGIQWTQALRLRGPVAVVLGAIYYPDDAAAHYGFEAKTLVDADPRIEALISRDLLRRFGGSTEGVTARARHGLGRIGDHVLELANEEKVDAIVVGTGQKTGLGRLGSVSSVIVNDARQSVVCVPPQANVPTMIVPTVRATLVATDLSPFANRAIAYAFTLTPPTAAVHIVHVIKDDDGNADSPTLLEQLKALAPVGSTQTVQAHVVRGDDAATTLAQTAALLGVDLICISSHGRSGIARALVGSVADKLLRATRLPVLVLRPA